MATKNTNPDEDTLTETEESSLFFVKKFVLSAERIGLRRSSGNPDVITELTAAASRSIPFAGPVIEKAFIRIVKSIQHHSQVKGSYQVELAVDEKVTGGSFRDDEKFRLVLIEAAIQVFYGFEYQLKNVYYKSVGESQRKMAVKILATVAGEECVKQMIRTKSAQNIHQSLFENGLDRRVLPHHRELLYQINNTDGDVIFAQKTTRYNFFKMCIPAFFNTTQETGDIQAGGGGGGSLVVVDKKRTDRVNEFHHLLRPCFAFEVQPTNPKRLNFVDLSVAAIRKVEEFIWKDRSDLIDTIFERLSREKPCNIELETLHEVKDIKTEVKDIRNLLLQSREGNKYKVKSGSVLIMNNLFQSQSQSTSDSLMVSDEAVVGSTCGKNHLHYRKGAEKDSERMRHFFQDVLANHVTFVKNVKSTELDGILKEFKKNCIEQNSDYLVLIIMSHGGEDPNTFLMDDLVPIDFYRQVFNKFNHDNFPHFTRKPKLFFLDFCNGANFCGVQDLCDSPTPNGGNGMELNPYCETVQYGKIRDYFIGQAACPSAWSYLNTTSGSFYSQALVKTFEDYWETTDLINMHKYVCDSVNLLSEQVHLSNKVKANNTNNSGSIQQPIQFSDFRLQFFFCQNNNDGPI